MKKLTLCLVTMAMMALTMTSCQKEEGIAASDLTFTATTEGGAKTHLTPDGFGLRWDNGDEIMISDGTNSATFAATSIADDASSATFTTSDNVTLAGNIYKAYYPASIYNEDGTVTLPATQQYVTTNSVGIPIIIVRGSLGSSSIDGFPMYAETRDCNLHFNNLCGIMRLNLQQSGVSVREIRITTDKGICGTFPIRQTTDGKYVVRAQSSAVSSGIDDEDYLIIGSTNSSDNGRTVTLDCGADGVDITTAKDFNIYLPAGIYNTFDIEIVATDGSICTKSLNNNNEITINRNEVVTLTCTNMNFVFPQHPFSVTFDGEELVFDNDYRATYQVVGPTKTYYLELYDDINNPQRVLSILIDYMLGSYSISAIEYAMIPNGPMWQYGIIDCEDFSCNAATDDPNTISFDIEGAWMYDGAVSYPLIDVHVDNITFTEGML